MKTKLQLLVILSLIVFSIYSSNYQRDILEKPWMNISKINHGSKSHVVPSLWGELPRLTAHSKVDILDVDGPGVVSLIHATAFVYGPGKHGFSGNSLGAQSIIVRVFYDNNIEPSIQMPFMDFFGDIQCQSDFFSIAYFSKVSQSHNFRLPMPFRKHIRIELENPSEENFGAYCEIQWEEVNEIPSDIGYLKTDFQHGVFKVDSPIELFNISQSGTIVAHWLQFENEKSGRGELLCEADQTIYLDGDDLPTLNHLGTEDLYGFSWGFHKVQSDGNCAIIKVENINPIGSRVAMIRSRENDIIRFRKSCRWVLTYENDPVSVTGMMGTPITYRHCVYYYTLDL